MRMENNSKSRTALITGASSGIGHSLAKLLAKNGFHLILMARRLEKLTDLQSDILSSIPDCQILCVKSDVSDHEQHMKDVKEACSHFDSLDLLIANAGVGLKTNEGENTWRSSSQTFSVNLLGAIASFEASKDIMLRQGFGHIVGITSLASLRGYAETSAYCASKSALATFMEAMRIDLYAHNITVTAVHPGFVDTPMTEQNGKMPFLLTSNQAAQIIWKAIQKKRARLFFPWQSSLLTKMIAAVPDGLYDYFSKKLVSRVSGFKKKRGS